MHWMYFAMYYLFKLGRIDINIEWNLNPLKAPYMRIICHQRNVLWFPAAENSYFFSSHCFSIRFYSNINWAFKRRLQYQATLTHHDSSSFLLSTTVSTLRQLGFYRSVRLLLIISQLVLDTLVVSLSFAVTKHYRHHQLIRLCRARFLHCWASVFADFLLLLPA